MDADIYKAVQTNDPTELKQLLNSGGDVNTIYQDLSLISTKSILHIGCEKGRIDCVKVGNEHVCLLVFVCLFVLRRFNHIFVHILATGLPNRLSWITNQ